MKLRLLVEVRKDKSNPTGEKEEVRMIYKIYKVFTIVSGEVSEGATVERFFLKGAGINIPAILVGEEGRGRQLGVVPVQLTAQQYEEWKEKGFVIIRAAEVGQTKAGKPKLFAKENADTDEKIICVFRTKIGFRGGNSHTGDRIGTTKDSWGDEHPVFAPFPGEILVKGVIAQGIAGRMGAGEQLVAVMPKGVVFRTGYSGRLYGEPAAHYYIWTGRLLLAATWEERQAADLF